MWKLNLEKMTKVYPNASSSSSPLHLINPNSNDDSDPVVLTVWKKSLLFNCDGFTVFDAHGNLLYRVDNYMSVNHGQIFLMDALGTTLLTIRRKKLSLGDTWLVFDGETSDNPRFLVRKNVNILNTKKSCLAEVRSCDKKSDDLVYEIEGSYAQRCCTMFDQKRRRVAEIKPKETSVRGVSIGNDIFHLVAYPGFDASLAMAFLILLDQMFTSPRPRLFKI